MSNTQFIGNTISDSQGVAGDTPFAAALAMVTITIMAIYLLVARRFGAFEAHLMGRPLLRVRRGRSTLAFLYLPLLVIFLYSFNAQRIQVWPIQQFTTNWYGEALANEDVRDAFFLSIEVALFAMVVALVLGSLAAFAVHRFHFFGRDVVSFFLDPADRPARAS